MIFLRPSIGKLTVFLGTSFTPSQTDFVGLGLTRLDYRRASLSHIVCFLRLHSKVLVLVPLAHSLYFTITISVFGSDFYKPNPSHSNSNGNINLECSSSIAPVIMYYK